MVHSGALHVVLMGLVALPWLGCSDDDAESMTKPSEATQDAAIGAGGRAGADADGGGKPISGKDSGRPERPASTGEVSANPNGTDPLPTLPEDVALPIVFAHGFAGSAQQYESQAMRFAANGYPLERIKAYDHDGAGLDIAGYVAGLDLVVEATREEFGVEQVYLVGHSRGTSVSNEYLSDPARAAKVAKYIALDGRPCPTVVPCLAPNQAGNPGQAHVEVATSRQSFAMQYQFLIGDAPAVVEIVAQREPVTISGRAVNFPANTGRENTTLDIWELDSETGERATSMPHATFAIGSDGHWGPTVVDSRKHYELALSAENGQSHHLYPQRFLRDSQLVRLLSGGPESASRMNSNTSATQANIIALRMREWYAMDDPDLPGDESDVLRISVKSASGDSDVGDVIADHVTNAAIGLHIHDAAASPGDSTLQPLPYFSTQPFQAGVDVYMPGADPPDGTITLTNLPRGDAAHPQTLNVPNWASATHTLTVMFSDSPQD